MGIKWLESDRLGSNGCRAIGWRSSGFVGDRVVVERLVGEQVVVEQFVGDQVVKWLESDRLGSNGCRVRLGIKWLQSDLLGIEWL